jgi:hypothetical protein
MSSPVLLNLTECFQNLLKIRTVDPLLVLLRLDRDPEFDPGVEIGDRRHQLEQLL